MIKVSLRASAHAGVAIPWLSGTQKRKAKPLSFRVERSGIEESTHFVYLIPPINA